MWQQLYTKVLKHLNVELAINLRFRIKMGKMYKQR